jgi:hypothetical protein
MKQKLAFSSLLLALSLASAPTARATTTWYVDGVNGSDSNNCMSSQTACRTIGHAISLAHSGDSIMVAAATYTENLTIGRSLNLIGSGSSTTIIDGNAAGTVITVSKAFANVALSNLTIQNGFAAYGGGINNSGTLTINNSIITRNKVNRGGGGWGGGINNDGILIVNSSTISQNSAPGNIFSPGNGGGIINSYILTINNSTVSGNSSFITGGIEQSGGTLTINNSTISGNTTSGLFTISVSAIDGIGITINNSTISGNTHQYLHGCTISGSGVFLSNTTISGNVTGSGKAALCATATLQNSIIAKNSGENCGTGVTSKGYNMSSDGTCNFANSGDRNHTDPKLGSLGYHGGPTQTIPLLSGSPAIDAGNPSGCTDGQGHLLTTDQRGRPRPDHEDSVGCDMGAYEKQTD